MACVANLLVFVELRDGGSATEPSLFALGEARRIAAEVGATVYTLSVLPCEDQQVIEEIASALGKAGADRVLCCAAPQPGFAPLDVALGGLLAAVTDRLRPRLIIFPAGGSGLELGAPLAIRTGALYHPHATLEISRQATDHDPGIRILLKRRMVRRDQVRTLDLRQVGRRVVTTLGAASSQPPRGGPAELDVLSLPADALRLAADISSEPDEQADFHSGLRLLLVAPSVASADRIRALRATAPPGLLVASAAEADTLEVASPSVLIEVGNDLAELDALAPPLAPAARVAIAGDASYRRHAGADVVLPQAAASVFSDLLAVFQRKDASA